MIRRIQHIKLPLTYGILVLVTVLMISCRSYNDLVMDFHKDLGTPDYSGAMKELDKSRFLKKKRNEILLYLEKGRVFHLQQQYDSSNYYLNKADLLMEEKNTAANVSTAVLVNEAMTRYGGEDFEKVLVNYYKALNYLFLNQNDEALVEAKRINLRLNALGDKQVMQGRRYTSDAFAHTLQGLIYERMNDYNNAFIAYRNAYELYEKNNQQYMGAPLPQQLKVDLINAAHKTGFYTERDYYCDKFNLPFSTIKDTAKQQLVFLWENGLAPVKEQQDITLFLVKGAGGDLMFSDKTGTINIPFPLPDDKKNASLSDLNIIRVAFPRYVDVPAFYANLKIVYGQKTYTTELAENINFIAKENLRERFLKEMTLTVSRIALKKLAEAQLKKENEVAGALVGIAGALAEKADTRNWQSLPAQISYIKIPLSNTSGAMEVQLSGANGNTVKDTLTIKPTHKLTFVNYNTLQHLPILYQ